MTQPMRSPYTSNCQFPQMESAFTTAPPESAKEPSSPLFVGLVCCLPLDHRILNCNYLFFQNKPILLSKSVK